MFLDDILVTGVDDNEHMATLRLVCKRLAENGFTVSKSKCKFFCEEIEYLGFVISRHGLQTAESKVKAVVEAPAPTDVTQVRAFLGLVTYYQKFLPHMSTILTPMYELLKKDVKFQWNFACSKAFKAIKEKLISADILAHFDPNLQITLACDASPYGVSAVISQIQTDGSERPISFASRTLSEAEKSMPR